MRATSPALPGSGVGRVLPWAIGSLVYLAVLAAAIAGAADGRLAAAAREPLFLSVTLPGSPDSGRAMADAQLALALLKRAPGVTLAAPAAATGEPAAIEPWLVAEKGSALPPRAIELAYDPQRDPTAIAGSLDALVPGAAMTLEETDAPATLASASEQRRLATGLGAALLLASVAAVMWFARLAFQAQLGTVDLLRSLGAGDGWLARQFERQFVAPAGLACAAAAVLAMLTLAGAAWLPELSPVAVATGLRMVDGILLLCIPVLALLGTAVAARLTIRLYLSRVA